MTKLPAQINLASKPDLKLLQEHLNEVLAAVHPGLKFSFGNGKFQPDGSGYEVKLQVIPAGGKPIEAKKMENDLQLMARAFNLDTTKVSPQGWRLVGWRAKAQKKPWVVSAPNGKQYIISDEIARKYFNK